MVDKGVVYWLEQAGNFRQQRDDAQASVMRLEMLLKASESLKGGYIDAVANLSDENERLRTALQNCRMFFDANNRPNYVAMIDEAMGNEQKVGDTK